ncbi:MAG: hemerythrin [Candidatus Cloacimonadota bacterium]|nr:MAG: hemerythrin [Candidatus Cloacimonadota bacterium]
MSELINNSKDRKEKLKKIILGLHKGDSEKKAKKEIKSLLNQISYGDIIEVEQELIEEGLDEKEVLKLCDIHASVLKDNIDLTSFKDVPIGHPIDLMINENKELTKVTKQVFNIINQIQSDTKFFDSILKLRELFNSLYDVDKHYQRKEYLLFPYLEKLGITGPPKVLWGKHDQIRELIKGSIEILKTPDLTKDDFLASSEIIIIPTLIDIDEMIIKEERILFPMSLDKLSESDWYEIDQQSLEIGYCLYDPQTQWVPEWVEKQSINQTQKFGENMQLPSGSFSAEELLSILNTLPLDMTFVDKNDKVKYFSQGSERIFVRNRAILNRDVRHCHPPASAHIVDKIIDDFKTGKQNRAPFWINMKDKMIHIEYFALKDESGNYLGTLEVSHDVSKYRALEGEQRILSYEK